MSLYFALTNTYRTASARVATLFCVAGLLLFFIAPLHGAVLPDTYIQHQPKVTFDSAQVIQVEAVISDSTGILSSRCYFRFQHEDEYLFVELESNDQGAYKGIIPAPAASVEQVEYFFLAVNENRQVVRSELYSLKKGGLSQSVEQEVSSDVISVKTDLPVVPLIFDGQFLNPDMVDIQSVEQRFGLVAGVYTPESIPAFEVVEGYFGGFMQGSDKTVSPIKGIVLQQQSQNSVGSVTNQLDLSGAATTQAEDSSDVVGPDIRGDDWSGVVYLMDSTGVSYGPVPVTAVIIQNSGNVSVTLTFHGTNWLGLGNYYWGSIFSNGNMSVYDHTYQTWTTHFGPATTTSVTLADWTEPYNQETNPRPDLYVIELTREPEPEFDPSVSLPGIFKLLLK